MDPNLFTWWLHGWAEINGGAAPTPAQWGIITDHLALAFRPPTAPAPSPVYAVTGGYISFTGGTNYIC